VSKVDERDRRQGLQMEMVHGMTWNFYQIDTGIRCNGSMYEVEPDVVLYVYGGWNGPQQLRYQLVGVTPTGVERLGAAK